MRLGVNIDHVATVRQARKAREPEPVAAAVLAELAGAQGITVHLRGDRRHIQERDLELLRAVLSTKLNIEMAATTEMVGIARRIQPDQVTLASKADVVAPISPMHFASRVGYFADQEGQVGPHPQSDRCPLAC